MKDLEKIKSEDLGCQVQDANPGNFGIEQEVAAMVGATVPAPSAPSADDARELGAQLLVFLRRALLPIRSALRTALADIYAHLDSRCTDYTPSAYDPLRAPFGPYDPMRPFVARTLPNLLTAITAFDSRKISNGSAPNDGIPDGVSLGHLICSPSAVTKILDDNHGWTYTDGGIAKLLTAFPNVTTLRLGMRNIQGNGRQIGSNSTLSGAIEFPDLETYGTPTADSTNGIIYGCPNVTELLMPKLSSVSHYSRNGGSAQWAMIGNMQGLVHVQFGTITTWTGSWTGYQNFIIDCPNLIDLEFGQGTCANIDLTYWNPTDKGTTFLQNFKEHIALRLTDQGSGKTLTLSQAVRDAIHAAEATYGIEAIIVTQKGWTLSPAPTA